MKFIDNQYLDKDKVDSVCEISKNDTFYNLETLFGLDMSKMKQKTELMILEDTKNNVKILSKLINEPKEKFQIKTHKRATIHTGQPTVLMNKCIINLTGHKPLYTVVEGRKETEELEKAASEMTGALPIVDADMNINKSIDLVAIGCAKAVALRTLSTTTYRPAAHTCVDGINVMLD